MTEAELRNRIPTFVLFRARRISVSRAKSSKKMPPRVIHSECTCLMECPFAFWLMLPSITYCD
jgi:hypothetical protein